MADHRRDLPLARGGPDGRGEGGGRPGGPGCALLLDGHRRLHGGEQGAGRRAPLSAATQRRPAAPAPGTTPTCSALSLRATSPVIAKKILDAWFAAEPDPTEAENVRRVEEMDRHRRPPRRERTPSSGQENRSLPQGSRSRFRFRMPSWAPVAAIVVVTAAVIGAFSPLPEGRQHNPASAITSTAPWTSTSAARRSRPPLLRGRRPHPRRRPDAHPPRVER